MILNGFDCVFPMSNAHDDAGLFGRSADLEVFW